MKLIKPNDLASISNLKPNEIAYPDIDYEDQILVRAKTTLKAAYTNIENTEAAKYLNDLSDVWNSNGGIDWQNKILNILQKDIFTSIKKHSETKDKELLKKIFVYIQLWGGNTSRGFFLRNGGFSQNFNEIIYLKSINYIKKNESAKALKELLNINQVGISFATKHLFFWSNGTLPIYDNIIAMLVFGRKPKNSLQDYSEYIDALNKMSIKMSKKTSSIERSLFNWADTQDGKKWICLRKNIL
jgi:hypothetical protein